MEDELLVCFCGGVERQPRQSREHTHTRTHPTCLHVFTLSFVLLFNLLRNIQHLLLLFGEASRAEQHQHAAFADAGLLIKAAGS